MLSAVPQGCSARDGAGFSKSIAAETAARAGIIF